MDIQWVVREFDYDEDIKWMETPALINTNIIRHMRDT